MSDTIISSESLGKAYVIRHQVGRAAYRRLSEDIVDAIKRPVRALARGPSAGDGLPPQKERFWALKDVSFAVQAGEAIGIIGRNGAGKSTLLKVLSRITEPTEGRVRIRGRVASLLEVGTGFHPELTGRENIFLNGTILGMTRREIQRKFDEIVAFAEIEKFLDTPVKRYSSGMYVRLAFAVAAHLEPEILIVDEVLAVGDVQFQKKCLGKMQDVSRAGGRTVLFVSHNMAAVQAFCARSVQLEKGRLVSSGQTDDVIQRYIDSSRCRAADAAEKEVPLGPNIVLRGLHFDPGIVVSGRSVSFRLALSALRATQLRELAVLLFSQQGTRVGAIDLRAVGVSGMVLSSEGLVFSGSIASLPLVEGEYRASIYIVTADFGGHFEDLTSLMVTEEEWSPGFVRYPPASRGIVHLDFRFEEPRLGVE